VLDKSALYCPRPGQGDRKGRPYMYGRGLPPPWGSNAPTLAFKEMTEQNVYDLMVGEDEEIERRAIQLLVERHLPAIRIVGSAATTTELLVRMHLARPHLVILDSHLPGSSLMTTLNLLLSQQSVLKVIILSDFDEGPLMAHCIRFGAFAYLTRPVQPDRLLSALNRAIIVLENAM
jgi:two-component system response regulator YesN